MCFKLASRGDSAWWFIGRGEDLLFLAHTAIKTFALESWSVIHVDPFRVLNPAPLFFHLETLLETCLCLMVLQTRNVFQLVRVHYPRIMHVCVSRCWTTWVGILSLPCPCHPSPGVEQSRYLCSELHTRVHPQQHPTLPSNHVEFIFPFWNVDYLKMCTVNLISSVKYCIVNVTVKNILSSACAVMV